jgi:hypothetical protein
MGRVRARLTLLRCPYMCGRYTVTIDKSTIEKRFGGRFYIARQEYFATHGTIAGEIEGASEPGHMWRLRAASGPGPHQNAARRKSCVRTCCRDARPTRLPCPLARQSGHGQTGARRYVPLADLSTCSNVRGS